MQSAAVCAAGLLAGGKAGAADSSNQLRELPLGMLKDRFYDPKRHLAAYETFTAGRGKGTAELVGAKTVTVQERVAEWIIRYVAPMEGIQPGGYVRFWLPNGASLPHLKDTRVSEADEKDKVVMADALFEKAVATAKATSLVTVIADGITHQAVIEPVYFMKQYELEAPTFRRVVKIILPKGLAAGQAVGLRWTDVEVEPSATRWGGDRMVFKIFADHDADGYDEEIMDCPVVEKHSGPVARLILRCSSTAVAGEPVRCNIAALDAFDNPAWRYRGTVTFGLDEGDAEAVVLPAGRGFRDEDFSCMEVFVTFKRSGFYWLKVIDVENGLSTVSNPIEVHAEEPECRLYWGEVHCHTDHSADARAVSTTTTDYAGAYKIGRYRCGLDFMAATDHHGVAQGNYSVSDWEVMKQITNAANEAGRFVTLIAVELSDPEGDQIVYFPDDSPPFVDHEPGSRGYPKRVWQTLRKRECFAVPHHFCQDMRPWNWDNFDGRMMPICEVFSNHGRGEFPENRPTFCPHHAATLPGRTWVEQLDRDRELGAIASSDDHTGRLGGCGLAAVWAPRLTRGDVYRALKTKRCYGTTDSRVILHFAVNGHSMGEEVMPSADRTFKMRAAAPTVIREIHLLKNGKIIYTTSPGTRLADFSWTESEKGDPAYYYVRLHLAPNPDCTNRGYRGGKEEYVWSSPVWIKPVGKA